MSLSRKERLKRTGLNALSYILPSKAKSVAADWFSQSRSAANPHKEAFTPFGAKAIPLKNPPPTKHEEADSSSQVSEYYVWGESGPMVLLVHGWGSDCASMFGFIQPLLKAGYRVAAFDGPAHGGSKGQLATMRQYVDSIRAVLLQIGEVQAIIAHSLGGIAAVAAARGLTGSGPESEANLVHHCAPLQRIALIAAPISLLAVLDAWAKTYLPQGRGLKQGILDQLLARNGVPVSHWDIALHGENWNIPALIIHDVKDMMVSYKHSEKIQDVFSQHESVNTSGLGHIKILTDKTIISDCVEFINQSSKVSTKANKKVLTSV